MLEPRIELEHEPDWTTRPDLVRVVDVGERAGLADAHVIEVLRRLGADFCARVDGIDVLWRYRDEFVAPAKNRFYRVVVDSSTRERSFSGTVRIHPDRVPTLNSNGTCSVARFDAWPTDDGRVQGRRLAAPSSSNANEILRESPDAVVVGRLAVPVEALCVTKIAGVAALRVLAGLDGGEPASSERKSSVARPFTSEDRELSNRLRAILDESDDAFAPELVLAIQCWEQEIRPHWSADSQMKAFVDALEARLTKGRHPWSKMEKLSERAIERITAIVTPSDRKRGGLTTSKKITP